MPTWSTDLAARAARRASGAPAPDAGQRAVVLVRTVADRALVAARSQRARAAGVRAGMTLAQARALLPPGALLDAPLDERRQRRALRALGEWATRYSPLVATDEPDGLVMDIGGCERIFGGEPALADDLARRVGAMGFDCRVAVAPTLAAAQALSAFGSRRVEIAGDDWRERVAALPVRALRVGEEDAEALEEMGVALIGQLEGLPRSALPARFAGETLRRLDQAMGRALETLAPVRPEGRVAASRDFAGPVKRVEAVELAVRGLLEELSRRLLSRERGARRVVLTLERSDLAPERIAVTLGRPSRDAKHLWTLLRPHVERAHLGFGVERVEVEATRSSPLRHAQRARWVSDDGVGDGDRAAGELLDTLASRFGRHRVRRIEAVETHEPERALRAVPFDAPRSREPAALARADRPTLVLDPPAPAEAIARSPDGPPSWLRWTGGEGEVAASGSVERVERAWWRPGARPGRDFHRVRDARGRWLWVWREGGTGRWWVGGIWA